jgi:hypothetical protein
MKVWTAISHKPIFVQIRTKYLNTVGNFYVGIMCILLANKGREYSPILK